MAEHSRKSLKSFYCRENLWNSFEAMAREANVSVDALLDDAMNQFLRRKDKGAPTDLSTSGQGRYPKSPSRQQVQSGAMATAGGYHGGGFEQQAQGKGAQVAPPPPLPQAGGERRAPHAQQMAPHIPAPAHTPIPGPAAQVHPAISSKQGQAMAGGWTGVSLTPPLYVYYNGKRQLVDKEQFVIGRSAQSADMTIKDGNISRKHCLVIYNGGQYFIRDLGSTNGVEFRGARIDSKHIDEGDVFTLCGHQIIFTYQG